MCEKLTKVRPTRSCDGRSHSRGNAGRRFNSQYSTGTQERAIAPTGVLKELRASPYDPRSLSESHRREG